MHSDAHARAHVHVHVHAHTRIAYIAKEKNAVIIAAHNTIDLFNK